MRHLLENFYSRGKKIIVTLSSTHCIEQNFDILKEFSNKSDIIFCNREEAEAFSKKPEGV